MAGEFPTPEFLCTPENKGDVTIVSQERGGLYNNEYKTTISVRVPLGYRLSRFIVRYRDRDGGEADIVNSESKREFTITEDPDRPGFFFGSIRVKAEFVRYYSNEILRSSTSGKILLGSNGKILFDA